MKMANDAMSSTCRPRRLDATCPRRRGLYVIRAIGATAWATDSRDEPLLASIAGASLSSRIATGERAGRPVLRLATVPPEVETRKAHRGAHTDGFDLHACSR
jgi:hypothetical protein